VKTFKPRQWRTSQGPKSRSGHSSGLQAIISTLYWTMHVCIAVPLTNKAILNQVLWSNQCDRAFGQLKVLCSSPVFWSPDFTWPFFLQTDVSEFGVSAVLSQHDDEGQDSGSSCHENSIIPPSDMNALPLNMESEPSRYIFWPDSSQYRLNTVPCDGWIDSRAGKTNANADTLSWMD